MTHSPTPSLVEELRENLVRGRKELWQEFSPRAPAQAWLEKHSLLLDETLQRIYSEAWRSARASLNLEQSEGEPELALLAIGGYGRAEMCPYSDIDIAFVPSEEENPLLDAVIKEAFRLIVEVLIDGARLEVGYAYRPISDCVHLDHTAKAALLEARLLAGSARLTRRLHEELGARWDAVEFLLDKTRERREISSRVRFSLYAVEPNLKEGTGALRDIQTALWVAGAMLRTKRAMYELELRGVVTAEDCRLAESANSFFLQLRIWVHLSSGKKNDVLRAELQHRCARAFGYAGSGALPSQKLLEDFYYHAEAALRFSEKVMRRLLEGPLPLDAHFVATHQRLGAAHPYVLLNHPELVLTPFALARKYGFQTNAELDRLVDEALPRVDAKVRRHATTRAAWFQLIGRIEDAAEALTELRGRGILQRYLPEFDAMLHLAPADPSHVLTVGEHSIYAVRQLGEMWSRRRDEDALLSVWDGIEDVEILVLATLLHDVGKIESGSDHSVSGERKVREIGARLNLGFERIERLALLVRQHLLLPRVARLRDLSSPGTIREVMEIVRDVTTLKMLYLLSLADTRAVGERSYSNLELSVMQELYERVLIAMTSEETAQALTDVEIREQMILRERGRLRREMRGLEFDDETLHRLCDNLPASYVLNTPLPTVATHLKFLEQLPQERVIVDFYQSGSEPYTEMTIVAYDDEKPGLLSKICGAVWAAGFEIHMAQVFTVRGSGFGGRVPGSGDNAEPSASEPETPNPEPGKNIVLDLLYVGRDGRALSATQSARLAVLVRELLSGEKTTEDALRAAGKETGIALAPSVISLRNDLSDEHSVLTIVNDNVPGLLYFLTRALAALNLDIHSAKITTWGGRVEDAFYVTRRDPDGASHKISDDEIKATLEALRRKLQRARK